MANVYCRFQKIAHRVRNSRKISKNLAKFANKLQILTKILRLETGAKECIV